MSLTFAVWRAVEKTLSIHSIHTVRREAFYWAAILFTFALGTAAGDLIGDLMSQPRQIAADADPGTGKGFGLGTTGTSIVFLTLILAVVVIMTRQQRRRVSVPRRLSRRPDDRGEEPWSP